MSETQNTDKIAKVGERHLPTLQDLYNDTPALREQNELNVLLNQHPSEKWLRKHPMAKRKVIISGVEHTVPVEYITIERVKYLLNRLFIKHKIEVKSVQIIANSVQVTVRLHYLDPITGEWDWHDGVGAAPINTKAGAGACDFMAVLPGAVQQAVPSAKSYAVKDAAHEIGKIFGRDINNGEDIDYDNLLNTFPNKEEIQRKVALVIQNIESDEERTSVLESLLAAEEQGTDSIEFLNEILKRYGKR